MIKTRQKIGLVLIGAAITVLSLFCALIGKDAEPVSAATMPKYTVALTGTVTRVVWGGGTTSNVENIDIRIGMYNTSGQKEDIILYLTGSSRPARRRCITMVMYLRQN